VIVLIPAYEPDERLVELVAALDDDGHRMIVVDDGSGPAYADVFDAVAGRGIEVLTQPRNTGKAQALRVGLRRIAAQHPGEDVVTADSDGQHRPDDIAAVARAAATGDGLVLGSRAFTGDVPARSRFGNGVSRWLFRAVAGVRVRDTQTGLRGIPAELIPEVLAVRGERFAWETNVLLEFARRGLPIVEVDIATVYLDGNRSSHFRPLRDSGAVLAPFARYVGVSFGSFLLDVAALEVLFLATENLLISTIGARVVSASANFAANRAVVFRASGGPLRRQIVRYAALAVAMWAAGYALLAAFVAAGAPLLVGKVVTDALVYVGGFLVQRGFVFVSHRGAPPRPAHLPPAHTADASRTLPADRVRANGG